MRTRASEREYQDELKQQDFNNDVTCQKLNIAKGEWALKQSQRRKQSRAGSRRQAAGGTARAAARHRGGLPEHGHCHPSGQRHLPSGCPTWRHCCAARARVIPIANALRKEGYTTSEIAKILQQMNQ